MRRTARFFIVAAALSLGLGPVLAAKSEGGKGLGLAVGDVAPDFTLRDQNLRETTLSEFRGKKNVVLAFFVFAFTGG
jgi:cytochrome oxidase Cu insertion factor (SCO1/SenC/PrrC family)